MAEEKANTSKVGSSAFFTKDQLTKAREAGYSEEEIALHISEGSDQIKNAMDEGYSLDEIADYFAVDPIASKEEATNTGDESPSLSDVGKGLVADIALAEGMKAVGAAGGSLLGPVGAAVGYTVGALGGGVSGSIAAQKIEGAKDISWGRVLVDTALNFIPGNKIGKAGGKLSKATGAIAKRPITSTAVIGGLSTPAYMAVEEISGDADYTFSDYAMGVGRGAALGGGLATAAKGTGILFRKFRNKTPEEIDDLIKNGDPTGIETVDILTAGMTPSELRLNTAEQVESVKDFIRTAQSKITPSRIIGRDATRIAKYSESAYEASVTQAGTLGKRIDDYLAKNPSDAVKLEASELLTGKTPSSNLLPENVRNDILETRRLVEEQQRALLDLHNSGALLMPDGKAMMIEESINKGDYLSQAYRFFTDPSYKPAKESAEKLKERLMLGLTKEQKEARLKKFVEDYRPPRNEVEALRRKHGVPPGGEGKSNEAYQRDLKSISTPSSSRISAFRKKLDADKYTEAQANEYIARLNSAMKTSDPDLVASFTQGAGTPNFLKEKQVLSPELESYLGRIDPIGERAAGTVSYLSRVNEITRADAEISDTLAKSGVLITSSDPRFTPNLVPIKLRRGEARIGDEVLYGDEATQVAINKIYGAKLDETSALLSKRTALDLYESLVSSYKATKVLGNIPAYLIQVPGNIVLTLGAGMNPILGAGGAIKMSLGSLRGTKLGNLPVLRNFADQAPPISLREFRNLQKRGMIASAVPFSDVQAGLSGKRVGRFVSKVLDTPGKVYSLPDNIFRIINYNNWKLELKRLFPTASDDLIEEGAARATTRTYPNYDSLSPELKAISRSGLGLGPFASYGLELVRTQYQQGRVIKELADGSFASKLGKEFEGLPINKKAEKMLAAKRAAGMATVYAGAAYGFNAINRETVSEEEENAFRETIAPDYASNKSLVIKRNKDGTYNYVNASYYAPQTMILAPFQSAMRGESLEDALGSFAETIKEDYGGAGTFALEELGQLVYGRGAETGKKISYAPTEIGQIKDRLVEMGKGLRPATIVALERDQPRSEKLARLGGLRIERTDNAKGFGFKARDVKESIDGIRSSLGGAVFQVRDGRMSPQEFSQKIEKDNSYYKSYMDRMQKHVSNLRVLGEDDSTIIPMLKDAGFTNLQTLDILQGQFTPIDPNKEETISEKYDRIRKPTDRETIKEIVKIGKTDPVMASRFESIFKKEKEAQRYPTTPKEKLIASLPTDEKVKRLLPEIMASSNPDAYILNLARKKIISKQDAEAIRINRNLK
jgi:hypothetical protein